MDETVYEKILRSAKAVLRREGRLTVRAVATEAEISPGTVTYYFRSLPHLIHELGRGYAARGRRRLEELRDGIDEGIVRGEVRAAVRNAFGHAEYLRAVERDVRAERVEAWRTFREHSALNEGGHEQSRHRKALALLFMLGIDELVCLDDDELMVWSGSASPAEARQFFEDAIASAAATLYFSESYTRTTREV